MFKINNIRQRVINLIKDWYSIQKEDIKNYYVALVETFYRDYDPLYYHRLGNIFSQYDGLYDALFVSESPTSREWYLDDNLLPKHRQSNNIVYDINISKGVHGGIQFIKGGLAPITKPSIENGMREFWNSYKYDQRMSILDSLLDKYFGEFLS